MSIMGNACSSICPPGTDLSPNKCFMYVVCLFVVELQPATESQEVSATGAAFAAASSGHVHYGYIKNLVKVTSVN